MATESWSPAAELSEFMSSTQVLGNRLATNIKVCQQFMGEQWATEQLAKLHANAVENGEAIVAAKELLEEIGAVPYVEYRGQIGRWLGIATTGENSYSLQTNHAGIQRILKFGHVTLVDSTPGQFLSQNAANVLSHRRGPVYMTLGSVLFPRPTPKDLTF